VSNKQFYVSKQHHECNQNELTEGLRKVLKASQW